MFWNRQGNYTSEPTTNHYMYHIPTKQSIVFQSNKYNYIHEHDKNDHGDTNGLRCKMRYTALL